MPLRVQAQLFFVRSVSSFLNFFLKSFGILFFRKIDNAPKKILVFKVGNIGDIVCAIPSFIAVRKNYPDAEITLLTSPCEINIPGAAELLAGAWYINRIIKYNVTDFGSLKGVFHLIRELRRERYDLFIHLPPHEWTNFRTMLRNMIFARLLGIKSAYGFRIRMIINLFRKTQIDYTMGRSGVDTLLDLLKEGGVRVREVEFDLPIPSGAERKVEDLLRNKWGDNQTGLLVAFQFGTKAKFPEKRWLPERFSAVLEYLIQKYHARIVILGGPDDLAEAKIISGKQKKGDFLITAGSLTVIESAALLKHCSFLLSIDSGPIHIMASFKKPTVALYSILNIFGPWFPYGTGHEIVFHRFLDCNYHNKKCVQKSMELITVDEVKAACDRLIKRL